MQRLKGNNGSMVQSGREIKGEELAEIQETVALFPCLNRYELARTISEHLGWFTASGGYKTDACLKLLERLEAKGCVKLRAKRASAAQKRPRIVFTARTEPKSEIWGSVGEIAPIRVELVNGREEGTLWSEYVSRYHYLGYKRPFGARLRYLAYVTRPERVIVGCIQFSSPSWRMKVRDQWIGLDDATRGGGSSTWSKTAGC